MYLRPRLISKTSLLHCWQPDVSTKEVSGHLTSLVSTGFCWSWECRRWRRTVQVPEWRVHRCYGTELLSTRHETVHIELNSTLDCQQVQQLRDCFRCGLSLAVNTEMMLFMRSVKLWTGAAEALFSLGKRVISPLWFMVNIEGFDFAVDNKYTRDTCVCDKKSISIVQTQN